MTKRAMPAIWILTGDIMGPLGGGFRQQRWAEYLLARGEPIRLFHVEGAFGVRYADVYSVNELHERRRGWIAAAPPRAGVRDSRAARVFRFVKHTFLIDLFLPSVFRLIKTVHMMLRDAPPHVVLMCSSPPYAMALAGRILKAIHGDRITMALDMRDLWSLHTAFPGPKVHKRLIERWVIGGADIFTTVAPALADRFRQWFGRGGEVVFNVATHAPAISADPAAFDWGAVDPRIRAESRKIVYTGSIPAGFYDLDGLLDAIGAFALRSEAANLQFVFVGAGGELAARAAGRGLPPNLVVFTPQVRHEMAAAIQVAADTLMFLGYRAADNQGQVSIKLFEYFRRSKPILPIHIRAGSDVAWLVEHYCSRPCPNLLDVVALGDAFADVATTGGKSLPAAQDVPAREASLLQAYEDVSDQIVARVAGARP
ncbi:hypothetical protein [Sphingomonas sanguinis]|uniref:Glycosyltransferase subfamily 4-like N-terminal domain-containing protein n=1 Tax=Sphingomonas sanguinis TaxID=33051 RepID=A0A147HWH9_9SPHN|nr:hypothetical protein [Sphingomonas sanguinis]KTT69251.1 hypothetical protein NS319_10970 [Sphingomonas sanguinis]